MKHKSIKVRIIAESGQVVIVLRANTKRRLQIQSSLQRL